MANIGVVSFDYNTFVKKLLFEKKKKKYVCSKKSCESIYREVVKSKMMNAQS